jgi:CLIP-associating protein 1/2
MRGLLVRRWSFCTGGGGQAGAVDEDWFLKAFEDVPTVQIFSPRDLDDSLTKIQNIISDPNQDWNKRVDAVSTSLNLYYYVRKKTTRFLP